MTFSKLPLVTDYLALPVHDALISVDPSEEMSASQATKIVNDLTCVGQTAPALIFQFAGSATLPVITPSSTWSNGWDSQWGNNILYRPALTRVSTGIINVVVPGQVPDFVGGTKLVNIRTVKCFTIGGNVFLNYIINVTSSSTFTISIGNNSGTLTDAVGSIIYVEAN